MPAPVTADREQPVTADREQPVGGRPPSAGEVGPAGLVLLAETGAWLTGTLNQRRCLRSIAELAVRHLADAVVILGTPDLGALRLRVGGQIEHFTVPEPGIAVLPEVVEALAYYPPGPVRHLNGTDLPTWARPGDRLPGDVLLAPLPGSAGPGGALLLLRDRDKLGFTGEEVGIASAFAAQAGAALAAAVLYRQQAEAMAVLRENLLPPRLPDTGRVQLAGCYQPAEHGLLIGGDFYDVFPPTETDPATVVVLGDVCGSGAAAAALTGKVRQTLRALHLVERRPEELLRVLNQALLQPDQDGPFVTLVIGSLTAPAPGRVSLTFATGGHPAPLVLRDDGGVEVVPVSGTLVGVLPELRIRTAQVELGPGETCLLYSDGVTEARGGAGERDQFGEPRLRRALAGCWGMPASATVERLQQLVSEWVHGGIYDDIAMLAIRAPSAGTAGIAGTAVTGRRR